MNKIVRIVWCSVDEAVRRSVYFSVWCTVEYYITLGRRSSLWESNLFSEFQSSVNNVTINKLKSYKF